MSRLFHSLAVNKVTVASSVVNLHDLVVNPLSVINIVLKPSNNTGTLSNYAGYFDLCGALNAVRILYKGMTVLNMTGKDLAMFNWLRHGIVPRDAHPSDTTTHKRCISLPIIMGKYAYDSDSCFPATRRGELQIELDLNASGTGWDTLTYTIETVELLGANPTEFERKAQVKGTFSSTGDQNIPLPVGNLCRGVMLFGTTPFTGATPAPSWGRTGLYLDNQQTGYSGTDFEASMLVSMLNGRIPPYGLDAHSHRVDATGSATQATFATPTEVGGPDSRINNYSFLDLDPTRDDEFSIDTAGHQNWQVRTSAGTADAYRIVCVERMKTEWVTQGGAV
jgi:hypothetical protein